MPELPEVETVRRGLAELIVGKIVANVVVHDSPKSFPTILGRFARQNDINVCPGSLFRRGKKCNIGNGYRTQKTFSHQRIGKS